MIRDIVRTYDLSREEVEAAIAGFLREVKNMPMGEGSPVFRFHAGHNGRGLTGVTIETKQRWEENL